MQVKSMHFYANANAALANQTLQGTLKKFGGGLANLRAKAVEDFGVADFEALRFSGEAIRNRSIEQLDTWLLQWEENAQRRGATVYWAKDGDEARDLVLEICRRHGAKKVTKSKSMLSEEAGLNDALSAAGIQPVETDLGEYIIQLANEPPSHIIAPAVHKNKEEVSDLFEKHHGRPRKTDIAEMTREAREVLREHFLSADVGISGGNFLIAETGSGVIVTNEGNGRMVTTVPKVHVCITGIEKVIPTLEDLSTLLRLLTRSATGQAISNYVSFFTGPKRADDLDGPAHLYYILVDGGRTNLVGSALEEMLRCIRCGACMNHCPVYRTVGGHAYGWVYPGPMGSVLTPAYVGVENALDLPHAATLCGACHVACPVRIPLPDLLRTLREQQVERKLRPWRERAGLVLWRFVAQRPMLYAALSGLAARVLHWMGGRDGLITSLPGAPGWSIGRDMPAPAGQTFRAQYAARQHAQR